MIELTLYGTAGCHLCTEAEQLLLAMGGLLLAPKVDRTNRRVLNSIKQRLPEQSLSESAAFVFRHLEITEHDNLVELMGERIPVLERPPMQMNWPFNQKMVETLLCDPQ